jgi:hypothetical protein
MVVITIIIETMYEAIFRHFKAIPDSWYFISHYDFKPVKQPENGLKQSGNDRQT